MYKGRAVYNIGDRLIHIPDGVACTITDKTKNGFAYDYRLEADTGDKYMIVKFKKTLDRDFKRIWENRECKFVRLWI